MPPKSAEALNSVVDAQVVQDRLKQVIRGRIENTIVRASALKNHSVVEVANPDDFLFGHWMSLILVSGSAIRVILKLSFDTATARIILANKLNKKFEDIDERIAMDQMREMCNLMAGSLKAAFTEAGIITGISIPLITSGFDEAVFSDKVDPGKILDVWKIVWESGELTCSTASDVLSWNDFKNLQIEKAQAEDGDGEGEFL